MAGRSISDAALKRLTALAILPSEMPAPGTFGAIQPMQIPAGGGRVAIPAPGVVEQAFGTGEDLATRVKRTYAPQTERNISFARLMAPEPTPTPLVPPETIEKRSSALTFAPATTTSQARRSAEEAMGITRPMYDNAKRAKKTRNQE